jgi:hypothetical protein
VGSSAGLDDVQKILDPAGTRLRPLGRPIHSKVVKLKQIKILPRVDHVIPSAVWL